LAIPPYTSPATSDAPALSTSARLGRAGNQSGIGATGFSLLERADEWVNRNRRAAQVAIDLAMLVTVAITFTSSVLPAEVMFHVVFVLLTIQAFLFGLRGTLLRIGIVSLPLLAYANARLLGWQEPRFDLTEWPLMFVIAVLVAWMADRRDATAQRYASLFRQASERLLTVEEDERRRIALELHDGVGQVLTALTLTLDSVDGGQGPASMQRVGTARGLADSALAEVRHLSHQMRPARIEERGLVAAIRDLASQAGFPVRVYLDSGITSDTRLDPTVTVGAYRIVQEALANAARHSGAPAADVTIGMDASRLWLVVADEGCGFDPALPRNPGIGVAGMYERAELLGGRLGIQSSPGAGTRVLLDLPIPTVVA
jgi:signal transduction histidine kinase